MTRLVGLYSCYTDRDYVDDISKGFEANRPKTGMNYLTSHYKDNGTTVNLKIDPTNKAKLIGGLFDFQFNWLEDLGEFKDILLSGNHSGDIYNERAVKEALLDSIKNRKDVRNIND